MASESPSRSANRTGEGGTVGARGNLPTRRQGAPKRVGVGIDELPMLPECLFRLISTGD